jgi:hypothetical protein
MKTKTQTKAPQLTESQVNRGFDWLIERFEQAYVHTDELVEAAKFCTAPKTVVLTAADRAAVVRAQKLYQQALMAVKAANAITAPLANRLERHFERAMDRIEEAAVLEDGGEK